MERWKAGLWEDLGWEEALERIWLYIHVSVRGGFEDPRQLPSAVVVQEQLGARRHSQHLLTYTILILNCMPKLSSTLIACYLWPEGIGDD